MSLKKYLKEGRKIAIGLRVDQNTFHMLKKLARKHDNTVATISRAIIEKYFTSTYSLDDEEMAVLIEAAEAGINMVECESNSPCIVKEGKYILCKDYGRLISVLKSVGVTGLDNCLEKMRCG